MTNQSDAAHYRPNFQKEIELMTGRSIWYSGFRQVIVGVVAAALTYGIGRLIGISVA